jgi:hypothetical protein
MGEGVTGAEAGAGGMLIDEAGGVGTAVGAEPIIGLDEVGGAGAVTGVGDAFGSDSGPGAESLSCVLSEAKT